MIEVVRRELERVYGQIQFQSLKGRVKKLLASDTSLLSTERAESREGQYLVDTKKYITIYESLERAKNILILFPF